MILGEVFHSGATCWAFRRLLKEPKNDLPIWNIPRGTKSCFASGMVALKLGPLDQPLGQGAMFQIYLTDIGPVLQALTVRNWAIYLAPREVWRRTGDRESGQKEVFVQDPDGYLIMVAHNIGERPLDA
jgi:hypothetical protein